MEMRLKKLGKRVAVSGLVLGRVLGLLILGFLIGATYTLPIAFLVMVLVGVLHSIAPGMVPPLGFWTVFVVLYMVLLIRSAFGPSIKSSG